MNIGIIGYGKMGRGIFSLLSEAKEKITVIVRDPAKAAQQGQRLEKRLRRAVRSGTLTESELEEQLSNLVFFSDLKELRDCDLIIETIVEDFESKAEILHRVESLVSPDTLITTNTSGLSVTDLGATLERPERFCGLHFFHPVQLTTVVEIIRTDSTGPKMLATLESVSHELLRKRPLVFRDMPGSCINAALAIVFCESLYILEQGLALPSQLDASAHAIVRVGPCASVDVVGLPLFAATLERSLRSITTAFSFPDLGRKLLSDGRYGKAINHGVYLYKGDRPLDDSPAYYRNPRQQHSRDGRGDDQALRERLSAALYYSVLLLAQMKLGSIEDLCAGIADVVGLKFDPLEKMKELGREGLRDMFERLSVELGPRYDYRPIKGILSSFDQSRVPEA